MLGVLLVAIAIFGLASGDIPRLWSTVILVVGALNVLRAIPHPDRRAATPAQTMSASTAA